MNKNLLNPFADDPPGYGSPLYKELRFNANAIVDIHDEVIRVMESYEHLTLPEVAVLEDVILAFEVMPDIPLEERWRDGKFIIYVDPTNLSRVRKLDFYKQLIHIRVKRDMRSPDSKILPDNRRRRRR